MKQFEILFNYEYHFIPMLELLAVFFILDAFLLIAFFSRSAALKKYLYPSKSLLKFSIYGAVTSILIIFPLTGILLMQFQTVFYPYIYLWLIVPFVPLTGAILAELSVNLSKILKRRIFIITALFLGVFLFFCGSMGTSDASEDTDSWSDNIFSYNECIPFLSRLEDISLAGEYKNKFTVIAPKEITEYIHMYSGNIATLYGRDLWDTGLDPYSYNEYPEEYYDLYTLEYYEESGGTFYYDSQGFPRYYDELLSGGYNLLDFKGGVPSVQLAKESGADAIIFCISPDTDTSALDYICEELKLSSEVFYITENKGYVIVYL